MSIDLTTMTIAKARIMLDAGEISTTELLDACKAQIAEKNEDIFAFLEEFDGAYEMAALAHDVIKAGEQKTLTGIPIAFKDNILVEGYEATACSNILKGHVAAYDSSVVAKLRDDKAVFIGRTNMDDSAMGSSTETSCYGPTKNPHDLTRVPGGSSGGSAAAVASNMVFAALGTDTAGSVRQPASLCGVVGLYPTYGTVSRHGIIAMANSFDQIGPMAKTVEDVELLYNAIVFEDVNDATSIRHVDRIAPPREVKRIGVPRNLVNLPGVRDDVKANFEEMLQGLEKQGYELVDIELKMAEIALPIYYIIMPCEASTNVARFDGVRYGARKSGKDVVDMYFKTKGAGYGEEVKRRIILGTFALSSGYADDYYKTAASARAQLADEFDVRFTNVDVIAMPTAPQPAFKLGEIADPVAMYAQDIFTVQANLTGLPAISVPSGDSKEGLPLGIQLMAPRFGEQRLFDVGKEIEKIVSGE